MLICSLWVRVRARARVRDVCGQCATCNVHADVECVMEAVSWATEAAERAAIALAEDELSAAEATAAAAAAAAPSGEWRRCFYWVDHMLQGKQHKKEQQTLDIANSLRLTGRLYYGVPGIIIVEGG